MTRKHKIIGGVVLFLLSCILIPVGIKGIGFLWNNPVALPWTTMFSVIGITILCIAISIGYWRLPEGGRKWIKNHGMQITISIVLLSLLTTYWSEIRETSGTLWNWNYFTGLGLYVWKGMCIIGFAAVALILYTLVTKPKNLVGPIGFWSIAFVLIGGIFLLGSVAWNEVAKDWVHETITTDPASRARAVSTANPKSLLELGGNYTFTLIKLDGSLQTRTMKLSSTGPFTLTSPKLILEATSDSTPEKLTGSFVATGKSGAMGIIEWNLTYNGSIWEGLYQTPNTNYVISLKP